MRAVLVTSWVAADGNPIFRRRLASGLGHCKGPASRFPPAAGLERVTMSQERLLTKKLPDKQIPVRVV